MNNTPTYNTSPAYMASINLSFNQISELFKNCYPFVSDGIYSMDDSELCDTDSNYNDEDIYNSDNNNDSIMSNDLTLETMTNGVINKL